MFGFYAKSNGGLIAFAQRHLNPFALSNGVKKVIWDDIGERFSQRTIENDVRNKNQIILD